MNGRWESSRMMLPQHKDSAIRSQKETYRIQRQALDEQGIHFISATLSQSQIKKRLYSSRYKTSISYELFRGW